MADQSPALPGSLPPSPAAVESPPLDPRAAALLAAEARSKLPPSNSPTTYSSAHSANASAPFNPSAADKLAFHRILDSELLPKCSKPQAVATLQTLLTITENILNPPNPQSAAKYRQLRLANAGIKRNIVDVSGAYDYLILAGFRRLTTDFEAHLVFASSPSPALVHKLKCANFCLLHKLRTASEAAEREKRYKNSEMDAEKERVHLAMLGFEEDRRLKREKDERDKLVREARAQAAALAAAALPTHPAMEGPSDAGSTMHVYDDGDDDPPPSYGQLHGRVLGTGEAVTVNAPRGVRMVSAQDEEFDDEE